MASLLPVEDAIRRIVEGVAPNPSERVAITAADGRVLAEPLAALRTQPPFDASAMDGFAVRAADASFAGARLTLVGTAAAGHRFAGQLGAAEAVRISTGAPVPTGADAILIQENASVDGATVTAAAPVIAGRHIRRAGYDLREGDVALEAGRTLGMREVAVAAAMGHGEVPVRGRPRVAILATGDELVPPGIKPGPDQIVATNTLAIMAYARSRGAEPVDLGIARDDMDAIDTAVELALAANADVIVTIGGASAGEHDLVRPALVRRGLALDFWRIAMRPGKPLMFGRLTRENGQTTRVLGFPGNPASSIVCALIFLTPLIDALLGRPQHDGSEPAVLGADIAANDERQDYLRAALTPRDAALPAAVPLAAQDSGMLSAFAAATCLLIRPPHAPAAKAGTPCRVLRLP